jgi:hypothetical protein
LTWLVPQLYRSRFLSGALNGNVGVVKSVLAELADDSNVAQAFSLLPLVFVIGQVIGFGLLVIHLFSCSRYSVRSVLLWAASYRDRKIAGRTTSPSPSGPNTHISSHV